MANSPLSNGDVGDISELDFLPQSLKWRSNVNSILICGWKLALPLHFHCIFTASAFPCGFGLIYLRYT